ncbi:hypothetical protein HPP92_017938 [Vanilla planifolia]|uniref:FAD dependent oxidoreductase domain-containing protein n=1 Tax=Vanilla planifolia TaxID=51239 RepID=A0A835UQ43_VANPL|nr:hypothetical protein HPP92_017938 [Vanilla planifolia]
MSELPHYHQMKATVTVPALCRRPQSHHPSLGTPRNPNDDKHITVESRCSHGNSLRSFLLHQAPLRISSPLASYRLFSPDSRPIRRVLCSQKNGKRTAKYAVLGAGFAGLSVAWHLLQQYSSKDSCMKIDLYDEVGIGGGASGSSGGLLHPYSPKAKLLWRGAESWKECMKLLTEAERVTGLSASRGTDENQTYSFDGPLILRRGILRPATAEAKMEILKANARNGISSCTIEILDGQAAKGLVPSLSVPLDLAVYFPQAMNIHPKRYLQALFVACENFANDISSTYASTEIKLRKKSVHSLHELDGEYDAVVVCLGAKVGTLPELSGRLPLRTCRGVIAELELLSNKGFFCKPLYFSVCTSRILTLIFLILQRT